MPKQEKFAGEVFMKVPPVRTEHLAQRAVGNRTQAGAASLMRGGFGDVRHGGALW